jgi:hypothetical protein
MDLYEWFRYRIGKYIYHGIWLGLALALLWQGTNQPDLGRWFFYVLSAGVFGAWALWNLRRRR